MTTRRRRTSGIQRRERASSDALSRRLDAPTGGGLPDWRLLAIGAVLLIGVVLVIMVLVLSSGSSASAGVQQANDGQAHVRPGSACRTSPASCSVDSNPYSSLPMTSGPHWDSPAEWGVYRTPQSESQMGHNLEHGGIVIWYDPELDAASIEELASYVSTQSASGISGRYKFILSPWGGEEPLPAPVVATAWRWLLELDTADTGAIDEFARDHYGLAPEPNGGPGPPAG